MPSLLCRIFSTRRVCSKIYQKTPGSGAYFAARLYWDTQGMRGGFRMVPPSHILYPLPRRRNILAAGHPHDDFSYSASHYRKVPLYETRVHRLREQTVSRPSPSFRQTQGGILSGTRQCRVIPGTSDFPHEDLREGQALAGSRERLAERRESGTARRCRARTVLVSVFEGRAPQGPFAAPETREMEKSLRAMSTRRYGRIGLGHHHGVTAPDCSRPNDRQRSQPHRLQEPFMREPRTPPHRGQVTRTHTRTEITA